MATKISIGRLQRLFNYGIGILLIISIVKITAFYLWYGHQTQFKQAIETRFKVHDVANDMRQNSDYLSRMIRNYVVTGESFHRKQFLATLAIRKKESSHPHFYNIDTSDTSNIAEPQMIKDQERNGVFLDQLTKAGFTGDGKAVVDEVEYETDSLVMLMIEAFYAMEGRFKDENGQYTVSGPPDQKYASELVYGTTYNKAKNRVTNKLNTSFNALEATTADEVTRQHESLLTLLVIIASTFLILAAILAFLFIINSRLRSIIVTELNAQVEARTIELKQINEQNIQLNEELETQNEELTQLNEELMQTNGALYDQQQVTTEAKERFEYLFNINPDSVLITRLDNGKITNANNGFAKIFGHAAEDCIGKTTDDLKIWPAPEQRDLYIQSVRTRGELYDYETRLCRKDGTMLDIVVSSAIIDIGGEPHLINVGHDITLRKQAIERLKANEKALRESQKIAGLGSYTLDFGSGTWTNSDILDEIFGIDSSFVRSIDNWARLMHPDWKDEMYRYLNEEVIGKGIRFDREYKIIRVNDGQECWVHGLGDLEKDANGMPLKITGTIMDITERKQAQDKIVQSEELFRLLAENSTDMIARHDLNGVFLYVSPACINVIGYQPEELIGHSAFEYFHPDDISAIEQNRKKIIGESAASTITFRFLCKNGEYVWLESSTKTIYDSHTGAVKELHAASRDITLRHKAEEALKASELRYRMLFDEMLEGFVLQELRYDRSGTPVDCQIITVNPAFERITGIPAAYATGKNVSEITKGTDPAWLETYAKVLRTGKAESFIHFSKDVNKYIKISVFAHQGNQIAALFEDITERTLAEIQLNAQERFLRTLTDNIPGMVAYWTKDLRCGFSNKAYLNWFGKTNDEMTGISITELMGEVLYGINRPHIENALKGIPQKFERTLIKATGETGYTWAHYIPDFREDDVIGFYALIYDITEIKLAELKIQQQNRELTELNATKDKFFSIIGHDLRGPLGSLRMLNQILIKNINEYDSQGILEMLTLFDNVTSQTYYLIENLLEWSRIQRGQLKSNIEQCNINMLTQSVTALFEEKARSKKVVISNTIPAELNVYCDPNMTKTIIRNLISNALKFVNHGGTVNLSTSICDGYVEVCIRDNGLGIPSEKFHRLFDLATNETTHGTDKETGTGLGLPLCRELVEKQNGKIWVTGEVGKGAAFYFTLMRENNAAEIKSKQQS